ncbi:hypothetical protein [Streptomyces sp. WAC00263]|uniref:hypothetical protein n=1 Tax=Streptomyces sp. WAC00263 TaxID=1917422 RepID=UPI0019D69557|nr:hypothetical protein [Streptomyces sp. WAC00263]KAF5999127.1 hypothetical protein BOG92_052580 [Streptomyces sp. WAC00263]
MRSHRGGRGRPASAARIRADRLSAGTLSQLNLSLALLADPEMPYPGFTRIRGDYLLGAAVRTS